MTEASLLRTKTEKHFSTQTKQLWWDQEVYCLLKTSLESYVNLFVVSFKSQNISKFCLLKNPLHPTACLVLHCTLILQFMIQSLCEPREFFLSVTNTNLPHCLMTTTPGKARGYKGELQSRI